MSKTVYVTKAQSRAASAIVSRSAVSGRYVRPGVAKIAAAAGGSKRSAPPEASQPPKKK